MARKPKSEQYNYVLDWLREAHEARRPQNAFVERTVRAYQGHPQSNYYKASILSAAASLAQSDKIKAAELKRIASEVPDRTSMTLHDAVETVVSMAQGGVGRYEFGPYDPDMDKDNDTIDLLASAAKHFYNTEKVDSLMPQWIRLALLSGAAYLHLKQKNGKMVLTMLETWQAITDPKRMKVNHERFIGFKQRESWAAVKSRIRSTRGGYMIKTINEGDQYVAEIANQLNSVNDHDPTENFLHDSVRKDIDIFYAPLLSRIKDIRKNDPNFSYSGDEIEMSYLYDLQNDMYFEIMNMRYIVVGKPNDLKRSVKCDFENPATGKTVKRTKEIKLDHPIIELPCLKTNWDSFPISPLFYILDDFDSLCAMESVLYHNLSIMAPLTFIGQSSDAEKVGRSTSIAGEIVEALPQTFKVMDKTHDMTAVLAAIKRYEDRIKHVIGAMDPFEMNAMLGDRASAKEVTAMSGQISQRLNPFIANIESAVATLGDKFIKLRLIMNEGKYTFTHNGKYAELDPQDMAGDYEVQAKLVSSIKLEQEANSRKALELIQYLGQTDKIDDKQFFATLIPIVLSNLVTREQAENMTAEKYRPMDEEMIASIKKRAKEDAERHPVDKMDFSDLTDEQLQELTNTMGNAAADPQQELYGTDFNPNPAGPIDPSQMTPDQLAALPIDPAAPADAAAATGAPVAPTAPPAPAPSGGGRQVMLNGVPAGADAAGEVANDPGRTA